MEARLMKGEKYERDKQTGSKKFERNRQTEGTEMERQRGETSRKPTFYTSGYTCSVSFV
jgi:hypothetical protein